MILTLPALAIIFVLILVTVAIAALLLLPAMVEQKLIFEAEPDRPCPFGPDMAWIAVRTEVPEKVAQLLGLDAPQPSNWSSGIGTVYDPVLGQQRVFVSPPCRGWVFAVGAALPLPQGPGFIDKYTGLHLGLAEQFPDVQSFAAFSDLDLYAWSRIASPTPQNSAAPGAKASVGKAGGGRIERSFAVTDAGVIISRGKPTREERALGLKLYELRGVRGRKGDAGGELLMHPTIEHVMRLAGQWSLNPTLLADDESTGHGYIGLAPAQWRSERLRKTA